jgi:hypothetical protein
MTYDFEVFPYRGDQDAGKIAAWVADRCGKSGVSLDVEVHLRTRGEKRSPGGLAAAVLRDCLKWGPALWREGDYRFDFACPSFSWQNGNLDLTPGEALFLYRALVQQKVDRSELFYLKHLRRRFGKSFLEGYL